MNLLFAGGQRKTALKKRSAYLSGQLPGGCQNQGQRVLLPASAVAGAIVSSGRRTGFVDSVQNGNEESSGFTTSGLGASHQIPLGQDDRDSIFLENSKKNGVTFGEIWSKLKKSRHT